MKKSISVVLKTFGVVFISSAVLLAWTSFNSFLERINNGSRLMFADAEIFLVLMLFFLIAGIFCLWIETKIYDPIKIK
jgi:cell division protein FtsX